MSCPIFTKSPSRTVSSVIRPAILKERSTSVNSRLPETRMRSVGLLNCPVRHIHSATPAAATTMNIRIRFFIGWFSLVDVFCDGSRGRSQIEASQVVIVPRIHLVVARALQACLRVGDLHRGSHTRFIAALGLCQLIFRQHEAFARRIHFGRGGTQTFERYAHLQLNLLAQIARADLLLAILREGFAPAALAP